MLVMLYLVHDKQMNTFKILSIVFTCFNDNLISTQGIKSDVDTLMHMKI